MREYKLFGHQIFSSDCGRVQDEILDKSHCSIKNSLSDDHENISHGLVRANDRVSESILGVGGQLIRTFWNILISRSLSNNVVVQKHEESRSSDDYQPTQRQSNKEVPRMTGTWDLSLRFES